MLIKWQDNNQVTMGTNVQDENVTLAYGTCQRWNASAKKRIVITQLTTIKHYNKYMGVLICSINTEDCIEFESGQKMVVSIFQVLFEWGGSKQTCGYCTGKMFQGILCWNS